MLMARLRSASADGLRRSFQAPWRALRSAGRRVSRKMICVPTRARLPGTQHDPPIVDRVLLEQQDLKLPARVRIHAAEAGGDHARVVEHQEIAGLQVLEQVAEPAMLDLAGVTMQNQQTRLVALRRRRLRDQFRRQLKIEIRGSHVARALFQCASGTRRQVQGEL